MTGLDRGALALFVHEGRPEAIALGAEVCAWATARGQAVVGPASEVDAVRAAGGEEIQADDGRGALDLVVAIGGDGTMLRGTRRAVEADAPVLGINLGQLGYLAEIEPGAWAAALDGYVAGQHVLAERQLASARLQPSRGAAARTLPPALNEVVIEKQALGRTIRLGVTIDGEFFTSYVADGLILATPTGSTAYSLSARGPIVAPTHRALLLTPVSPHSLFDRSLVLEPSSTVAVELLDDRPAAVAIDGEHIVDLEPGAVVSVTSADRPARFVAFGRNNFHQILKAKFGLSDR